MDRILILDIITAKVSTEFCWSPGDKNTLLVIHTEDILITAPTRLMPIVYIFGAGILPSGSSDVSWCLPIQKLLRLDAIITDI